MNEGDFYKAEYLRTRQKLDAALEEIERLTELKEKARADSNFYRNALDTCIRSRDRWMNWLFAASDRNRALSEAAHELILDAGVEDIDPRLDYLIVQIDRSVWNDFVQAHKGKKPGEESNEG